MTSLAVIFGLFSLSANAGIISFSGSLERMCAITAQDSGEEAGKQQLVCFGKKLTDYQKEEENKLFDSMKEISKPISRLEVLTSQYSPMQACVQYSDRTVECFGYPSYNSTDFDKIPEMGAFVSTALSSEGFCGLKENNELFCAGYNYYRSATKQSKGTAFGGNSRGLGCIYDSATKKQECWGNFSEILFSVEPLKLEPTWYVAGINHICAANSETVQCWGANHRNQRDVPHFRGKITKISANDSTTCLLTDKERLHCWGGDSEGGNLTVPFIEGVKDFAVASSGICAQIAEGLVCWGSPDLVNSIPASIVAPKENWPSGIALPEEPKPATPPQGGGEQGDGVLN